jgi:hypothetical protein
MSMYGRRFFRFWVVAFSMRWLVELCDQNQLGGLVRGCPLSSEDLGSSFTKRSANEG